MEARFAAAPDLDDLAASIRGTIIRPGDPRYDDARQVLNRAYDLRPTAIVEVANDGDVALAVSFARRAGLELAVRSGGHSAAGHSGTDGGILIDLSGLKGLYIDPARRVAWAGAGVTAGEFTEAAAAHGLATPFGDTASVGLGGLTLGGGIGFLARKHGLAIDNLLAVELVT
ncbi:MAG: FAD-binding oxidoreductase, partial [Chloroflexota bacterium]